MELQSDQQSEGVSASSNRYLFCGRIRAKQQSLDAPEGNLGKSRMSLPCTIASQLLCKWIIWWGRDNASWHRRSLPSAVRCRNSFFHCLKMNPPGREEKGRAGLSNGAQNILTALGVVMVVAGAVWAMYMRIKEWTKCHLIIPED